MNIPSDPEALRYDRDLTREELGRTVQALSDKLDVPGRTRERLHRSARSAQDNADRAAQVVKQIPLPAIGVTAAGAIAAVWLVRRKRS